MADILFATFKVFLNYLFTYLDFFDKRGVAQLVERRSPKPKAAGSKPATPASKSGIFVFNIRYVMTTPAQFGKQVKQEISKVTWPTRKEATVSTITVVILCAMASIFVFVVDSVLGVAMKIILGLGG